jgi:anti-sigma regulatory factor (Ser/Thr protein kinase)
MEDISLHILDIAENSIAAGATLIRINITVDIRKDLLSVEIEDNGKGIPEELIENVLDPFYTTRKTRKVGLGLSLLAQSAREASGDMSIQSEEGTGTKVTARFQHSHIDRKPLGSMTDTSMVLIAGNPDVDFVFTYIKNKNNYVLDTRQMKSELDGVPINSSRVLSVIRNSLEENLRDINK